MKTETHFKRVRGLLRPETLRGKHVAVVGAGSGGSRVAIEVGRLGVGLLIIDRPGECLEAHNILRHELGYSSLGQPKPTALAAHIRNYNPEVQIAVAECDVTADLEQFESLVVGHKTDLILGCTDTQASTHALNTSAVHLDLPLIGAAVYDGGVGGHVFRVAPHEACYACITPYLNLRSETQSPSRSIDYSNPDLDTLQSTSALNLDIAQIALIQARIALQVLLGSETDLTGLPPEVNLITFANRIHPTAFPRPLHAEFRILPRDPECLICGQAGGATPPNG
jgi:molybdopterin/thiamine biosynthesis adenylyltransferase